MWSWLLHVTGTDDTSGYWYGFWSGFGSDIGELAIVGGLIGLIRHKNCHVHHCWRLGRHPFGEFMVCRKHHPDDAPTANDLTKANQCEH